MVAVADADGEADEPGSWHPDKARMAASNEAEARIRFMVGVLGWDDKNRMFSRAERGLPAPTVMEDMQATVEARNPRPAPMSNAVSRSADAWTRRRPSPTRHLNRIADGPDPWGSAACEPRASRSLGGCSTPRTAAFGVCTREAVRPRRASPVGRDSIPHGPLTLRVARRLNNGNNLRRIVAHALTSPRSPSYRRGCSLFIMRPMEAA